MKEDNAVPQSEEKEGFLVKKKMEEREMGGIELNRLDYTKIRYTVTTTF